MTTDHASLFIGGTWIAPNSTTRISVHSASTEELLGSVPEANEADVDAAVTAARRAFDAPGGWSQWEPARRAEVLDLLADEFDKRSENIFQAI